MMNYYDILRELYVPEFGSIWKAPNCIWTSGFAHNGAEKGLHPSIVEKVLKDEITVRLVPGTSKNYRTGRCVYVVKMGDDERISHFLIDLSMPYHIDELKKLDRGWNGVDDLNEEQKSRFNLQIMACRGTR
jgi:hypothetical protein